MKFFYFCLLVLVAGCATKKQVSAFEYVMSHNDPNLKRVFSNPKKYEVQLLYTRVFVEPQKVRFNTDSYLVNYQNYFYPASAVKLPISLLALEKISRINEIDLNTKYQIKNDTVFHTIGKDITEIFAVSDNDSYNRLFEFLGGQDSINARLKYLGIESQINHRLSVPNSGDLNSKEIIFENTIAFPSVQSLPIQQLTIDNLKKGTRYFKNDTLVYEPMDFSFKNYYPIEAMHKTMRQIFYPNSIPKNQRFQLSNENLEFLKKAMKKVPNEAGYFGEEYTDGYAKFFIYGDTKNKIPKHIEIYNKSGQAYGTLTDNAYIVDRKNNIAFFLTTTLLVNENETFNDDTYEYETVGIPFLAALGRAFYEYELKKK